MWLDEGDVEAAVAVEVEEDEEEEEKKLMWSEAQTADMCWCCCGLHRATDPVDREGCRLCRQRSWAKPLECLRADRNSIAKVAWWCSDFPCCNRVCGF